MLRCRCMMFLEPSTVYSPRPQAGGGGSDDAFSPVPYEKGCNLLMYLEQKLGGPGQSFTVVFHLAQLQAKWP